MKDNNNVLKPTHSNLELSGYRISDMLKENLWKKNQLLIMKVTCAIPIFQSFLL